MSTLLVLFLVVGLGSAGVLILLGRSRPERVTLVLGVVVVVVGLGATGVEVAAGIADRQVDFRGTLNVEDFNRPEEEKDRQDRIAEGYAYLSSIDGEMTKPKAGTAALVLWSIAKLAPWLLAAIVLVLVLPILRAARRGEPFWRGATNRLNRVGMLLLLGIPAIVILQFVVSSRLSSGGAVDPFPTPALTISITHLLPGFLVLALVGIFRRGVELQDLERQTI